MYTIVEIISIQKGSEDFWSGGGQQKPRWDQASLILASSSGRGELIT
jgi:hypothetical protein